MPSTQAISAPPDRKPRDDEIDVYGLTHPGKVRKDNQDHFLVCALRQVGDGSAHQPSDPEHLLAGQPTRRPANDGRRRRRRRQQGRRGQPQALEAVSRYVSRSMHCYYAAGSADDRSSPTACRRGPPSATRGVGAARRGGARVPGHGHHAHALPRPLAPRLSAPGGRQPLLPAPRRRADPDHPGPDDGAGADRPRRHDTGGPRAPASSTPSPARSAGPDRAGGHPVRADLGHRGPALQRRAHPARPRRADPRTAPHDDLVKQVCEALLQDALEGGGSDNVTIVVRRAVASEG